MSGFAGSAIGAVGGLAASDVSVQLGGTGYGDGITELQLVRAAISAAAGCAGSAAVGGKCAPAAVTAAFASLYNGDGGWSKYGWAAAEVGAGFIPGVGEAQDLSVLFGKDSSGFERFFAGASLVVNVLTGGLAPNAGSYIRAGSHLCSFDGDTRVKTRLGLLPIKQLKAREHEVWARDADTGEMGWKPITATHINRYDETVTLTIRDGETGATQRIVSNRVHPFYVAHVETKPRLVVNAATLLVGRNASGRWVEAQHLAAGDLLLDADGTFSEVVARSIERSPLTAYNLTVTDFHTYFVAGAEAANDNAPAVWVHNCVLDNAAKGAAGEAKTLQTLGDSVAGTQVSIRTSNGSLTRVDALTTDLVAVETKTGGGGLTLNQAQLFSDVRAGRVVTPVGQNAANAGLTPGQPIRLNGCHLNRC